MEKIRKAQAGLVEVVFGHHSHLRLKIIDFFGDWFICSEHNSLFGFIISPMAKVDVELVKLILQRNELDIRTVSRIMDDIEVELLNNVDEDKPPPVKKQWCMLVSDPENTLAGKDFTGWVVQIPEEDSPATAQGRIIKAAYDFNASPKGQRMPVQTIGETCEVIPARFFREQGVWLKTKIPVLLLTIDNKIPRRG
tara:strand:+ start:628 stop:1212 length:585 start_codon:yes stop_codon:yes gene_type:complete